MQAVMSQLKGVAIIQDGDKLYQLRTGEPCSSAVLINDSVAARLLAGAQDVVAVEAGSIDEIKAELERRESRADLFQATMILLDGENSQELRKLAAEQLNKNADSFDWEWIESVLLSTPVPSTADPKGANAWPTPLSGCFNHMASLKAAHNPACTR